MRALPQGSFSQVGMLGSGQESFMRSMKRG